MATMRRIPIWLPFLITIVLPSCRNLIDTRNQDFYGYSRFEDLRRVPLIEPYEALSADGYSWYIERQGDDADVINSIADIEAVGVKDSIILLQVARNYSQSTGPYCVIDARTLTENYVHVLGDADQLLRPFKASEMELHPIQEVFEVFDGGGELPWR